MSQTREQYTMGYGPAATAIMAVRTAQGHAAFFLPQLKPGMSVLDCGCGPGTITIGFAELVAPGQVVGTEIEDSHVALARANAAKRNVSNVRFEPADIYALPFDSASFDAVFISAVVGNLREPVRGLREAYRVLKPGGVIGIKEFDHGGDLLYPLDAALKQYNACYCRLRSENGHDPESGRKVGAFLLDAGFRNVKMSACYESMADPNALRGIAGAFAGLLSDGWGDAFKDRGWATNEDIREMSDAWLRFPETPGAFYAGAWVEVMAQKDGAS
ncbi:MAG: methyltransferase domain-containing protein [Pyrinomonadaceae bacterium]|nr:methyltransferase domain-containing protein [Pyrinomonadaceae bacterium]